jgi:hypothetical protein
MEIDTKNACNILTELGYPPVKKGFIKIYKNGIQSSANERTLILIEKQIEKLKEIYGKL